MAFVPFYGGARIEMIFTQAEQRVENVYHIHKNVEIAYTAVELIAAAARFKDWWDANIKNKVVTAVSLVNITATALDTATSPGIDFNVGLPMTGSSAFSGLPNNVTLAVRWSTSLRGRSHRGRTYHIGTPNNVYFDSTVTSVYAADLAAGYNALIATVAGNTPPATLCVASYVTGGDDRAQVLDTPITGASVERTMDSQRRRLPGRGA